MNFDREGSIPETLLLCLGKMREPTTEAFRVQHELGVRSLEETPAALARAGYELCYVDLPENVSGFADIIAGKPHVVLNRAKSLQELRYTMPHELGHHILHLNQVREPDPLGFAGIGDAELEANLFAASLAVVPSKGSAAERCVDSK